MAKHLCDREFEVLQCAASGAAGSELREHIAACSTCREIYDVAKSVVDDRATLMRNAPIPSAGLVWWRANMRAQREAARAAVRVGSVIHAVLLISAVAVALAIVGNSVDVRAAVHSIVTATQTFAIPVLALAAWLILAPVAVYFAVTEK